MTITRIIMLEEIKCGTCSIHFAVDSEWIANRRSEGGFIHCPNGCKRGWMESDADRLRKQLEAKERELLESKCEALRQSQLKVEAQRALETTQRKLMRVAKGVCPDCHRTFSNLARHIACKHSKP